MTAQAEPATQLHARRACWPPDTGLGGSIGKLESPEALVAIGLLVAVAIVRLVPGAASCG